VCPFHSIGCLLLLRPDISPIILNAVSTQGQISAYVNRVLKSVVLNGRCQEYTSYSLRRGPTSYAASHGGVTVHDIIIRGGWAMDSISTAFKYIVASETGDQRVALIVMGWKDADNGGVAPSFEWASGTRLSDQLQTSTDKLFETSMTGWD
jgi:hypothetical protein